MEFEKIVKSRYAARKFDGKKLPEDKLNKLLEMIRFAPSSYNIQPWHVEIITDDKIKEEIQKVSWNQPQVTTCSHLLVFCARTDVKHLIDKLADLLKKDNPGQDFSGYVKMMYDFEAGMSTEHKKSWAQRQTYIALSNALNGAKALGFDSCPMEGFDPSQVSKILKLPENIVPTVLCPVGYAAEGPKNKTRFSSKDVFSFR